MINKAEAARALEDEIVTMLTRLQCAEVSLRQIEEEFFDGLIAMERHAEVPKLLKMHADQYRPFAFIAADYLFQIRKILEELEQKIESRPEAVTSESGTDKQTT